MAGRQEQIPREQPTLVFSSPEEASGFQERLVKRQEKEHTPDVRDTKGVISRELQQEFEKHGEAVDTVREPWQHSPSEHEEAQRLVNIAFENDLGAAIQEARRSPHYPRNLDLAHDVMTVELYEMMKQQKVNVQSMSPLILTLSIGVAVVCLVSLGIVWLSLR